MDADLSAWAQIDVEGGEEHLVMDLTAQNTDSEVQNFKAGGVLGKHKVYEEMRFCTKIFGNNQRFPFLNYFGI